VFSLKDLKLNDLIKIALTATAIIALTFNVVIASNNTTIINNYVQETNKKLETIQKSSNETQGNITKVKSDISKTLTISKQILNQVD
jgi:hypothetical protein